MLPFSEPRYPRKHKVRIVGLGPSGCLAINHFVILGGFPSTMFIAFSGEEGGLDRCQASYRIPCHDGISEEVVSALTRVMEGTELIVVAGSTDNGVAPIVLRAARAVGAAVARVVRNPTTTNHLHATGHMINDILAEHHAWFAGDLNGRAASKDDEYSTDAASDVGGLEQ